MKRFLSHIFILLTVFVFFMNTPTIVFGAENTTTSESRKCTGEQAKLYFENPDTVVASYLPDYYCSDILYLINVQGGKNLSLDEYKSLYIKEAQGQFSYLREIGITPDRLEDIRDMFEKEISDDTETSVADDYDVDTLRDSFKSRDSINTLLKSSVGSMRGGFDYIVATYADFEPDKELFDGENVGDILNNLEFRKVISIINKVFPYQ